MIKRIELPLNEDLVRSLKAGDNVLISGEMYTARDVAHKRLCNLIKTGEKLPIPIENQTIYFVGPSPAKSGAVIGSAGPTTSYRMDAYSPLLIEKGLRGMIGKGGRSSEVIESMNKFGAIYFAAVGGAAALISKSILSAELICYEDLGTEAIRKLTVYEFPAIVAIDSYGNSLYDR